MTSALLLLRCDRSNLLLLAAAFHDPNLVVALEQAEGWVVAGTEVVVLHNGDPGVHESPSELSGVGDHRRLCGEAAVGLDIHHKGLLFLQVHSFVSGLWGGFLRRKAKVFLCVIIRTINAHNATCHYRSIHQYRAWPCLRHQLKNNCNSRTWKEKGTKKLILKSFSQVGPAAGISLVLTGAAWHHQ